MFNLVDPNMIFIRANQNKLMRFSDEFSHPFAQFSTRLFFYKISKLNSQLRKTIDFIFNLPAIIKMIHLAF